MLKNCLLDLSLRLTSHWCKRIFIINSLRTKLFMEAFAPLERCIAHSKVLVDKFGLFRPELMLVEALPNSDSSVFMKYIFYIIVSVITSSYL